MIRPSKATVSVVIPCFNDSETIADCVNSAVASFADITSELQIIVVDDGSTDNSAAVLRSLMTRCHQLEVITHDYNLGYGTGISHGIAKARHAYIVCADGDAQFALADSIGMVQMLADGHDVVSGCRQPRADVWFRCVLGHMFKHAVRVLFTPDIKDVDCGLKVMRREAAKVIFPVRSNMAVWVEAMSKAHRWGFRCTSVKVQHRHRVSGKSTFFRPANVARLAYEVWRLFGNRSGSDQEMLHDIATGSKAISSIKSL